jgi:Trk K+ transport system NAD-binding subunit
VLVVEVRRGAERFVPRGATALRPGDVVTLYAEDTEALQAARRILVGPA